MSDPATHADDAGFMARALELAARGLYSTSPNPHVGCVLVRDGVIVGEGFHETPGQAHAEVLAIRAAGEFARGATAYVTLEPCNHFGKTPPCVNALIDAGVARVVAAMRDPNPIAAGGAERLRAAGIAIDFGLLAADAHELNIGWLHRLQHGRPWFRMKVAASLDGRTALADGRSHWITGEAARADGHHWRARACCVLTGIGTVRDDDPRLTVRAVPTPRQPLRVLVDSRLEVPLDAKILQGGQVLVACAIDDPARAQRLVDRGAEVLMLPNASAKVDLAQLAHELGRRGWNEVHVEAGHKLNGSLLAAGLVDEIVTYFAPKLIGTSGQGMFDLPAPASLDAARVVAIRDVLRIGPDLRVTARVVNTVVHSGHIADTAR